jgi:hypothetical protein
VTERLEQGNHRRQLGGATERTVDENEGLHAGIPAIVT